MFYITQVENNATAKENEGRHQFFDLTRGVTRAKLVEYGSLLLLIGLFGGVFRFVMRRTLTGVSRHLR